jgi:dipeptidase D
MLRKLVLATLLTASVAHAAPPSEAARSTAKYARAKYGEQVITSLASMVSYNTVADPKVPFETNPHHIGFKKFLKAEAERLGFDYEDSGWVVVIGYGKGTERVGIVTHGDVQPVDPTKWKQSPFKLDRTSEPGKLLARGSEDDKGPIATALYAMKAIKDKKVKLNKRIELYVYMGEESDWSALEAYIKTHKLPEINITLDAEYPVVTAEKGWGALMMTLPPVQSAPAQGPALSELTGGFFGSQIPEDAVAVIDNATPELAEQIRVRGAAQKGMQYSFSWEGQRLRVKAKGLSAHSSKPEDGVNAIGMLADALAVRNWEGTQAGNMASLINELIGTGLYGEKFGQAAYSDDFMGPLTVSPTVLKQTDKGLELNVNLRRPRGKAGPELQAQLESAFNAWKAQRAPDATLRAIIGEPWLRPDAPQIPTLLNVFSHYTGIKDPKPVSIGGGTNSRLFPNAVSFGPTMPGKVYTGHSEHEFITTRQLLLNLEMYTAVLVELAR